MKIEDEDGKSDGGGEDGGRMEIEDGDDRGR